MEQSVAERSAVIEAASNYSRRDCIIAPEFEINENAYPTVCPVTIYVAQESFATEEVVTPEAPLVEAAKGA